MRLLLVLAALIATVVGTLAVLGMAAMKPRTQNVLLGLNMQKHTDASGTPLVGRYALDDTMQDIKVDARAACLVATLGYLMNPARRAIKSAEDIKE